MVRLNYIIPKILSNGSFFHKKVLKHGAIFSKITSNKQKSQNFRKKQNKTKKQKQKQKQKQTGRLGEP